MCVGGGSCLEIIYEYSSANIFSERREEEEEEEGCVLEILKINYGSVKRLINA